MSDELKKKLILKEKTKDYDEFIVIRRHIPVIQHNPFYDWLIEHQDNSFVQNCLGEIHFQNQRMDEAVKWFTKSIKQGNKWSYYDLGWMATGGHLHDISQEQGLQLYVKSLSPGFTEAIGELLTCGFVQTKENQRFLYDLCLKYNVGYKMSQKLSILSKDLVDEMNSCLENTNKYTQTVEEWYIMDRKYTQYIIYKKKSFVLMYDTLVNMPKELVQLSVDYL